MNSKVYVFGDLSEGYSQYPNDATEDIFKYEKTYAVAPAQIVVHRRGELMMYSYILNFGQNCIGFCMIYNGVMFKDFDRMFKIFENLVEELIKYGYVIGLDESGNIKPLSSQLYLSKEELNFIDNTLERAFGQLAQYELPAVDYAFAKSSKIEHAVSDNPDTIIKDSAKYAYTFIFKSDNYLSSQANSFQGVLKKTADKINALTEENNALTEELEQVKAKKKQIKLVSWLGCGILLCGIIVLGLTSNLSNAKDKIQSLNQEVGQRNVVIDSLRYVISDKDYEISNLNSRVNSKDNEISRLNSQKRILETRLDEIAATYPLTITSVSFENVNYNGTLLNTYGTRVSASTVRYLRPRIYYKGWKSGSINLRIKLYKPNGTLETGNSSPSGATYSTSIYVSQGSNNAHLLGWGSSEGGAYNTRGTYRCEIWYGNRCLYSQNFTVV